MGYKPMTNQIKVDIKFYGNLGSSHLITFLESYFIILNSEFCKTKRCYNF